MAVPTNALLSYSAVGNREDLENTIYKVAANKTPFTSQLAKSKATNTYHEWQLFSLRTPSADNYNLQGDDTAATAAKVTTRVGNRTQIFKESGTVSGTQEAVDAAGREEMAWQKLNKGEELATDIEARCIGNKASVAGAAGTEPQTGGALAWLTSNVSRGSGGSSGGFSAGVVSAATNGTQRTLTEALLKAVLATAFGNGAMPSVAFMGATHKQICSSFTGIADIRADVSGKGQATIYAGADGYVSDFGLITFVPHQYGLTRDMLLIDPAYWGMATLRPMKTEALAKTGDAEKFQIVTEKALVCRNQKASAVIADLT